MKIAVVMAARNAERFVSDALQSLLRQRDAAMLDILVIDDGSTDATAAIVRDIAERAAEVRLLTAGEPGTSRGISATRNIGLAAIAADTDLWTCLDADDLSPPDRFKRDIAWFEADPALELHYGCMNLFRETEPDGLTPRLLDEPITVRGMQLGAMLQRVSLLPRVGLFDKDLSQGEDADFLFRSIEVQPRTKLVDDICVHYRRHPGNISKNVAGYKRGFASAVAKSLRRRRATGAPAVPVGFFDGSQMPENAAWW